MTEAVDHPKLASKKIKIIGSADGQGMYLVEASKPLLHGSHSKVIYAMVICHGRLRNAVDYYETGISLLEQANQDQSLWIVVAPQYLDVSDVQFNQLGADYLAWNKDWQSGVSATVGGSISSYTLLDDVLLHLCNKSRFPKLQHIAVVGHGGGAQLLNRYAIASRLEGINVPNHFVIANPGSYVFFGGSRPIHLSPDELCPALLDWKYGTDNLVPYCEGDPPLITRFQSKETILLLGNKDLKADGILDNSCPARAQGRNRYERGINFIQNIASQTESFPLFSYFIVDGVGHNESKMLTSKEGLQAIFKHVY